MSSVELLCFDLDDTLWAATPVLLRAEEIQFEWLKAHLPRIVAAYDVGAMQARRRALMRERPALAHDFTALRRVAMAELCAACGYETALGDAAVDVFLEARSAVTLYEEVDEVLRDLRRNYRLASLTNGNTDLVRAGVAQYFDYMLSPVDTGCSKPDPRMFEAVLVRAGLAASAMVHIGDEPWHDVEGAHRAQVRAVWLNRDGRLWPEGARRAHAEIGSLRELRAALERLQDRNGETPPA